MQSEWDGVSPKTVSTNPGMPKGMEKFLQELQAIEWEQAAQKRMYVELLPNFVEERLLHVSGAEQIAREWHKRRDGSGWDSLTTTTQALHIKAFAQLLNDGVIVAGPQLFRQVD